MKFFKERSQTKVVLLYTFLFVSLSSLAQKNISDVNKFMKQLCENENVSLINLASTPANNEFSLVKIGDTEKEKPAIFIAANMEGTNLISTLGALWFANYVSNMTDTIHDVNWYILPCGNPDAYQRYFDTPKWESKTNGTQVNNDNDEQTDEDGSEDLNNDGMITQMLVKHPLGEYIKDTTDSRLIRKAKTNKGEKGIYKIYSEGIDNDGDGEYNEDPPGGVIVNHNFNYMYEPFIPEHGKWNGSEPEAFSLMKFFSEHPEIALVVVLDETDNLLFPPETDTKKSKGQKIKVPGYYAERLGVDAKKTYTPEELKEEIDRNADDKEYGNRIYLTLLNSKPPEEIQSEDVLFYKQASEEYKEYLKKINLPADYEKLPGWQNGSFEEFAYFEYGLPVFSINPCPLTIFKPSEKDSVKKKEEEKTYEEKRLAYADSMGLDAFAGWQKIQHPDFEEVEIGGLKPFFMLCLPADSLEKRFKLQLPFISKLAQKLPSFSTDYKLEKIGGGLVKLDIFITNNGELPYPTFMGSRNNKPAPVVFTIEGDVGFLSGKARTPVQGIGSNQTRKFTFMLNKMNEKILTLRFESKNVIIHQPIVKIELQ
ncbi:MAG: hypothetical protein JW798_02655 [Prolixibacteraceae bacterium]|nr:hypothetical protein [Prolixibacteraceae bacterium]